MEEIFSQNSFLSLIMKLNLIKKEPKKIKDKTKAYLLDAYNEDVLSLSKLCDFDFSQKMVGLIEQFITDVEKVIKVLVQNEV